MPLYRYRAMNQSGRNVSGMLNAVNVMDLESSLSVMGLDLVRHAEIKHGALSSLFQGRVTNDDLIQLCVHLEQLDRAGVPLLDALNDVREATHAQHLHQVLTEVVKNVGEGMHLSRALARHPKIFSPVFTGVVAAGEQSGSLSEAFKHLGDHLKWLADTAEKIRKATRYPLFMLAMVAAVVGLMMVFVVPQVASFLISTTGELPFMTRALIWTSDFIATYWWVILGLPAVAVLALQIAAHRSPRAARRLDAAMFRIPVVGVVLQKLALARFAHFFALTFRSGIDILDCLKTGEGVVGNHALAHALQSARLDIQAGSSLSNALNATGQFPHLVVRMFRIGEETGKLDEALENIGYFYDREVDNAVQRMIGMIEPGLTLVIGAVVLWVVVGVIGPIYDSIGSLGL
jgi:type IV pilus assembly protein PilC